MTYERAYKEEPDSWLPIGKKDLRQVFTQNFEDIYAEIEKLDAGEVIRTQFASYRKRSNI